ncbi:MAG: T9SS type A sorting domain-containing protein [Armatimonadota bacterium]
MNAGTPADGRGQWRTTINVQTVGGNVTPANMTGGSGSGFLFTNGGNCGSSGLYDRKWVFGGIGQGALDAVNGTSYFTAGGTDMGLNMATTGYYTFVFQDAGCANANFYVGRTSSLPVTLTHSGPAQRTVNANGSVNVTFGLSATPSPQELFYVRYRVGANDFSTGASIIQGSVTGTSVTAVIPAQPNGSVVYYHAFSSTRSLASLNTSSESDRSLSAISFTDSSGNNFRFNCVGNVINWTGAVSTNWHFAGNWSPAAVPGQFDDAIITNSIFANQPTIIGANATCRSITIGNGNSLTMSGGRLLQVFGTFFTNNGNFIAGSGNEIVEFTGPVTINGTIATSFNNCVINNSTSFTPGLIPTMIGVFTLNPGSFVNTAPNYGSSSRLNYNIGGPYNVGAEWTGATVSAGLGNPNDVSISGNTLLSLPATPRGLSGTVFITSGTLRLNGAIGADLYVGKDWQRTTGTGFFTPNGRAVWFRGFGNQEIRVMGNGTEVFNYLIIDKPVVGTRLFPSNTGGSLTDITINGMNGDILQLNNNGRLDINGRIFRLDGNDPFNNTGNISVVGAQRILNSAIGGSNSGSFSITGTNNPNQPTYRTKSVRNAGSSGRLVFENTVLLTIADGMMDFGYDGTTNLTTVEGVLQVNLGGSVWPNSCFFSGPSPASTLRFANTIDYQVNSFDKTWSQGAIYSGLPGIPWNVEVNNVNTDLTINDVRALRNNITITDGRFTLTAGPFNIGGNWTRVNPAGLSTPPCEFIPNTNRVIFDKTGLGDQIITCTVDDSVETFYGLEISPANANVQLAPRTDVVVTDSLFLTTGKLDLNKDTLTLGFDGFAGNLVGGNSNSYLIGYKSSVNGVFKRFIPYNGVYQFPFGDSLNFSPLQLEMTSANYGVDAFIHSSLYDTVHPNMAPFLVFISRYWKLSPNSIFTPVFNTTYRYVDADVVGNESSILPYRFDSSWVGSGGSNAAVFAGTGSISTATNLLTWIGMTSFGDFTGVGEPVTLPVTLLHFTATLEGDHGALSWSTASEINNDYFTLERSWNGIQFEPIHFEPGAGNSTNVISYRHLDRDVVLSGRKVVYYRLKQTDFDGSFTYTEPIALELYYKGKDDFIVYPNPFNGSFSIAIGSIANGPLTIELTDMAGKTVSKQEISRTSSHEIVSIGGLEQLAAGVYTLSIRSDGRTIHKRVNKN